MGHRRLAIIDLDERSAQPMVSTSGRSWIVFNGEIYNYKELRSELIERGHHFRTDGDTEVILAAWEEWGEDCLRRFVGMFAFVIYDHETARVFAARDNFGIKPLYFWRQGRSIAFASEIKQFMQLPGFDARMNEARVYDFLVSGLVGQTNETTFAGVNHVRAGHSLLINLRSNDPWNNIEPKRWYHLPEPGSIKLSMDEATEKFYDLFVNSVGIHLRADVTVGSCLSGGLDSSAIVATMARLLGDAGRNGGIHTISSCFEEKEVDERQYIKEVVRSTGAKSTFVFPRWQDLPSQIERISWHQEEPFGSTSIYAQWCVFQEAGREGLKVMLDGQGADEQLAGYHGVFQVYMAQLIREKRWSDFLLTAMGRKRHHGQPLLPQLGPVLGDRLHNFLSRKFAPQRSGAAVPYPQFIASDAFPQADRAKPPYMIAMERDGLTSLETVGDLCRALTQTINLPVLLHFEDRNSMAHSVEARVPFLDHRLVDFTIGLGSEHKVVHHLTKTILRRAMRGTVPDKILTRQDKLGFPAPEEIWFKGPLKGWVQGRLEESLAQLKGLIDPDGVRTLARQILDGERPFDNTLWRIIQLGIWRQVFNVSY